MCDGELRVTSHGVDRLTHLLRVLLRIQRVEQRQCGVPGVTSGDLRNGDAGLTRGRIGGI